jgi:hypothetical protein
LSDLRSDKHSDCHSEATTPEQSDASNEEDTSESEKSDTEALMDVDTSDMVAEVPPVNISEEVEPTSNSLEKGMLLLFIHLIF